MGLGRVFGLTVAVEDGIELPGIALGPGHASPPTTAITRTSAERIDATWPSTGSVRERELVHPDGDVLLSIDRGGDAGYRIDAPNHAHLVVDRHGATVQFAPRPDNAAGATSVLIGQALPLAATLQGLEILHAGGVVMDGCAVAVCARSGGGKSNLVARLVARGATLLADDAVAVEVRDGTALAHPGPAFVHLLEEDAAALEDGVRLSRIEGFRTGKAALGAAPADGPATLGLVYLLDHGEQAGRVRISDEPEALRSVLGATFVTVARTDERLRRHMLIGSVVADRATVRRVEVGASDADAVAEAVWRDMAAR